MDTHQLLSSAEDLLNQGLISEAIELYHQILADPAAPIEVNLRLGRLYQKRREDDMALFHFSIVADNFKDGPVKLAALLQMVKLEPNQPTHRLRLAELYRKGGNQRRAFKEYSKATELMAYAGSAALAEVMECLVRVMPNNTSLSTELGRLRKLASVALVLDATDRSDQSSPVVEFQAVETRAETRAGYQPLMGSRPLMGSGSSREKLHALDAQRQFMVEGDGMPER